MAIKLFTAKNNIAKCPICNSEELQQIVEPQYQEDKDTYLHYIPTCVKCGFSPSPLFYNQDSDRRSQHAPAVWDLFVHLFKTQVNDLKKYVNILNQVYLAKYELEPSEDYLAKVEKFLSSTNEEEKHPLTFLTKLATGTFQYSLLNGLITSKREYCGNISNYTIVKQGTNLNVLLKSLVVFKQPLSTLEKINLGTSIANQIDSILTTLVKKNSQFFTSPYRLFDEPPLHPEEWEYVLNVNLDDLLKCIEVVTQLKVDGVIQ